MPRDGSPDPHSRANQREAGLCGVGDPYPPGVGRSEPMSLRIVGDFIELDRERERNQQIPLRRTALDV
jgi:hypothetical protein